MVSSPSPPAFTPRRPPKRTYGRRGRVFKTRDTTPDAGSDTDVDSDNDHPVAPTPKGPKRARPSRGADEDSSPRGARMGSHSRGGSGSQPHVTIASPFASPGPDDLAPRSFARSRAELGESSQSSRLTPSMPSMQSLQSLATVTAPGSPLQTNGSRQGSMPPRPPRRRMLGRAESMQVASSKAQVASAPSTPRTPRPLKTTQSMPTPGSGRSRASHDVGSAPASPNVAPLVPVAMGSPSPVKAKRTYGGSRSFLANRPTDLETALSEDAQPSYSELRKTYEVDVGDDEVMRNLTEEFNLARAPEPINDMRSKGENRLFMDDINVLLGDINNPTQSLALRRSSAIDVLQKMQEGEWMARLRRHTETVFTSLCSARGEDAVLGAACLLFLALLAKAGGLRHVLEGDEESVVAILSSHIDLTAGPLDQGYKGKRSLSIDRLRTVATKIFDEQDVGGSRGIASYVLAEAFQDSVTTPQFQAAVSHEEIALTLFQRLKDDGALLRARMEMYRNSIDLLPSDGTVDLDAIEQGLRALSRIVALSFQDREQLCQQRECITSLLHVLVSMVAVAVDEEEDDENIQRQAARCTVLSLQILAPLADPVRMSDGAKEALAAAHEDDATFAAFGRLMLQRNRWPELCKSATARERTASPSSSPVKPSEELPNDVEAAENLEAIELLIFMSPVLDRILPTTRSAAIKVATTSVSGCGKRACIFGCRCLSSISFASLIVSLYNEYLVEQEHGRALLLSMFLTLLLTRLLVAAPTHVRPLVQRELAGATWRAQLEGLRDRLTDFGSMYATVRAQVGGQAGVTIDHDAGDTMLDEALRDLQPLIAAA